MKTGSILHSLASLQANSLLPIHHLADAHAVTSLAPWTQMMHQRPRHTSTTVCLYSAWLSVSVSGEAAHMLGVVCGGLLVKLLDCPACRRFLALWTRFLPRPAALALGRGMQPSLALPV